MQEQQALTFKAKLGDEIRRFSVPASAEWKEIIGKIYSVFSIGNHERISVKYEDDEEELVTIDSTAELEEVKRMFNNQCIRLTITKVAGSLAASAPPRDNNNNENFQDSGRNWRQSGKRKEWKRKGNNNYDIPKEELDRKLAILQERGFNCKWKNIKMLKMNNGDVEKVCELYLERKNKRNKYAAEMKILEEKGFTEPIINFKLLKRYDGNMEKVIDILTKAKKFECTTPNQDNSCIQFIVIRLLVKYDGNVEEVQKIWEKKQDKFLQKAQKKRDKAECKWKSRCEKKCSKGEKGEKDWDCPISRAWNKRGCGQKSDCDNKGEKEYDCPISRAWNKRGCGRKSSCCDNNKGEKGEKDWECPIRSRWCKKDKDKRQS
jgi:hypothetical protein